jgi:transposase
MLGGNEVNQIHELHGQQLSIRAIGRRLGLARNTVRKYLREPGVPRMTPRPGRPSKLEPYRRHLDARLAQGITNAAILLRELRAQGYGGGRTILKDYLRPRRPPRTAPATMRFETAPGEQAQVDWGHFAYTTPAGERRWLWAFVMVLAWSRALYVEFVRRADVATFIRCHIHAFTAFGGVVQRCLYDNAKVVVLGRDAGGEPRWNPLFLDFALRVGFALKVCAPYRAQTKGRVESGVKYVRGNFWPTAAFTDDADLNAQARTWIDGVAHERVHGTTRERPADRLRREQPTLRALPAAERLAPFLREARKVARDGFVSWEGAWYGVPWQWAGQLVHVAPAATTVHLFAGTEELVVHPRATQPGQRLIAPGQWTGLPRGVARSRPEPLAVQCPTIDVEQRALTVYDAVAGGAA